MVRLSHPICRCRDRGHPGFGEGDSVGADARLVYAANLRGSESSLTGESESIQKNIQAILPSVFVGDRVNMVFKGTAVAQGIGRAVVTATGMDTEMGEIAHLLESTNEESTPLQREIGRLGKMLGYAVIAIAIIVVSTVIAVFGVDSTHDAVTVLLLGVSLAVAAVPEGLPAILSVVFAIGVQRMAARKAIVKKLSSVETLGAASVICSDKTGTLTKSEMTIERIHHRVRRDITHWKRIPTGRNCIVQWKREHWSRTYSSRHGLCLAEAAGQAMPHCESKTANGRFRVILRRRHFWSPRTNWRAHRSISSNFSAKVRYLSPRNGS